MGKTPQDLYQEREKRLNDAIQLKVPDRVPIAPLFTFFAAKYAGITCQDAMYDYNKLAEATKKATVDFDVDVYSNPFGVIAPGPLLDILDDRRFKWPGPIRCFRCDLPPKKESSYNVSTFGLKRNLFSFLYGELDSPLSSRLAYR